MKMKEQIKLIEDQTEKIKEITKSLIHDLDNQTVKISNITDFRSNYGNLSGRIMFKCNLGEVYMSYADAWEIVYGSLDAFRVIDKHVDKVLENIDKEYDLGKF